MLRPRCSTSTVRNAFALDEIQFVPNRLIWAQEILVVPTFLRMCVQVDVRRDRVSTSRLLLLRQKDNFKKIPCSYV